MRTETTRENQSPSAHIHKDSTPQSKLLVIDRKSNVSVEQLFEAFTSAEALKAWWWPKDLHSDRIDFDFREGGKYFINMKGSVGGTDASGGMTGEFEEIVPNQRIVMTDSFASEPDPRRADDNGRAISAKEAKVPGSHWPERIFITFDFESVDENTSRFELSQQGIPNDAQKDCIQGWSESFDKLEEYLRARKH